MNETLNAVTSMAIITAALTPTYIYKIVAYKQLNTILPKTMVRSLQNYERTNWGTRQTAVAGILAGIFITVNSTAI